MTIIKRAELDIRMAAVDMQRLERLSATAIGERMGETPHRITQWFRMLHYDALAYHIDSIAADIEGGAGFYAALHAHGIADSWDMRKRARGMLVERGVLMPRVEGQYSQDTRPRCECGAVLEPDELASGVCEMCAGDAERVTEIEAEMELFSNAAFFNNPRNIGRFKRSEVDCIQGAIPIW